MLLAMIVSSVLRIIQKTAPLRTFQHRSAGNAAKHVHNIYYRGCTGQL